MRPAGGRPSTRGCEVVPFVIREGLDEIAVDGRGDRRRPGHRAARERRRGARPRCHDRGRDRPGRGRRGWWSSTSRPSSTAPCSGCRRARRMAACPIGAGLGRPLILSTLEDAEAMRSLTGGATGRSRVAVACLVAGVALIAAAALWWLVDALVGGGAATALAASPGPDPPARHGHAHERRRTGARRRSRCSPSRACWASRPSASSRASPTSDSLAGGLVPQTYWEVVATGRADGARRAGTFVPLARNVG